MAEKSRLLSKAEAFDQMGLGATSQTLWVSVASCEERIAPLLDVLGRDAEAALHRVSAAACYERSGDLIRAANLYCAALAGPLSPQAIAHVRERQNGCLDRLPRTLDESVA